MDGHISLTKSFNTSIPHNLKPYLYPSQTRWNKFVFFRDLLLMLKKCHLISLKNICTPKGESVLRFCSISSVNMSYIMKQGWDLMIKT